MLMYYYSLIFTQVTLHKALVHTAECKNGNILTGTKAPVILTSRSDEFEVKVNSIALAAIVAEKLK